MRKAMAAVAVAGTLLAGLAAASPALALQEDTQLCSPGTNGGDAVAGDGGNLVTQNFYLSGRVAPYTWSVAYGQLPPGLSLWSPYAPADNNSQLAGTPTQSGYLQVHDEGHRRRRPVGVTAVRPHH